MTERLTKELSEAAPAAVGTSGSAGTAPTKNHSDHVHSGAAVDHDHSDNTTTGGGANLSVGTIFAFQGDVSDTTTGTQENWGITNFSSNTFFRFNNASPLTIGGLTGGGDGRLVVFVNQGSSIVTLKDNSAASSSFNRIVCGGQDLIMYPGMGVMLIYASSGSTVWHVIGSLVTPAKVTQDYANFF